MLIGEWVRVAMAALVALGGLVMARERAELLTTEHVGIALFLGAVAYAMLRVSRHFDRRSGQTDQESP